MKRLVLAVVLVFAAGSAFAADLPSRAPVYKAPPAPSFSWTGGYFGVEGGVDWFKSRVDFVAGGPLTRGPSVSDTSGLVGGTIGYNWQNGLWVAGIEGDWSWTNIKAKNATSANCSPGDCVVKADWLATARGRLGYTITPNALLYVTGGAAFANLAMHLDFGGGGSTQNTDVKTGWTVGGGVEAMLNQNWSVKVEYLYIGLPDGPSLFNGVLTTDHPSDQSLQVVRAGLNYKF